MRRADAPRAQAFARRGGILRAGDARLELDVADRLERPLVVESDQVSVATATFRGCATW